MTRLFPFFFLLLQTQLAFAQNVKTISIDAADARTVDLSEIAETVTPIVLEESTGGIQNILMTDEYLFLISIRSIIQCNLSGKHIRTINCGGFIQFNITCDTLKKELYVPVKEKIKCYDYSGNLKKEFDLGTETLYCLWHKGYLWVLPYVYQPDDNIFVYQVNKINLTANEIVTLPFKLVDKPFLPDDLHPVGASIATFYKNEIVVCFEFDNTAYKIQKDEVIPLIQWNIVPPAQSYKDRNPALGKNGFIGDYLFINYHRGDLFNFYLENMKTGEKFNASEIVDDVYQTNENCRLRPVNQKDCFYFLKEKSEIKGGKIGNISVADDSAVIFIVKLK